MYKREIEAKIKSVLKRGKSVLLLGPRQTGKSTLIESQIASDFAVSLLINKLRQAYEMNPDLLIKEVVQIKKKMQRIPIVYIDEIQKVPPLMDSVQYLCDKKAAQFILTGSSARKLKEQMNINLLPGRVVYLRMEGLNLRELPAEDIEEFLIYGMLPGIRNTENSSDKNEDLITYVETYLEEEIRKEANLKKLSAFYRFLEMAALESGRIISLRKIAEETGLTHGTVGGYYEILEDSLIVDRIDPLIHSATRKKLIKSPKYLFFDLGVRRAAAREGEKLGRQRLGELFEQFIGMELLKLIRYHPLRYKLSFWRDADGPEVDWILVSSKKWIPIEVKFQDNPRLSDCRHLQTFMREYKNQVSKAYVLCTASHAFEITDNIIALPWQNLIEIL